MEASTREFSNLPMTCAHCKEVIVVVVMTDNLTTEDLNSFDCWNLNKDELMIFNQYPRDKTRAAPKDVPQRIGGIFLEAQENLSRGRFDTCVMLCGKVLDLSTKGMDPLWSLEKRLKKLAADGKISNDVAAWAEEIRLDRNDAVHSDTEFDRTDAEEILGFTEAFLNYIYTLPALVKQRRLNRDIEQLI